MEAAGVLGLYILFFVMGLLVLIPALVRIINRVSAPRRELLSLELQAHRVRLEELEEQLKKVVAMLEEIKVVLPPSKKVAGDAIMPSTGLKQ
jgi:hypothetical protein